ncbi:MAG: DUF1501 domain-containing protein, partial [Planctomycetaceae bacterium]
ALGGLSLPQILAAQSRNGETSRHKSVIMIYLAGGPPHQDLFDLKPDAPLEFRGEFEPINTNVPGIEISELLPKLASRMDKCAIIRSLVGAEGRHDSFECCTGHHARGNQPSGGWPALGSSLSKLRGSVHPSLPPYVDLSHKMAHDPWNIKGSGLLGLAHAPFRPDGQSMRNMTLDTAGANRMARRSSLLERLDQYRRSVDTFLQGGLYDTFTEQALSVLTSSRLVAAMDLSREDAAVRKRYGPDDTQVLGYSLDKGYQAVMSRFLQARRLVEAGVRCVTCSFAHFDWHGSNFRNARKVVPLLDQGIAALIDDLHERGLERDVTVLVWGEFGRTPRINKRGGRDHWPAVHACLLAGGGMQTGQVIGSTNRLAESARDRPVHMQDVLATVYHNLGIDVARTTIADHNGRPRYLLDRHQPLPELI